MFTLRCLYSYIHFGNIFTKADACLKNKSNMSKNLTPVSIKLTTTTKKVVKVIWDLDIYRDGLGNRTMDSRGRKLHHLLTT